MENRGGGGVQEWEREGQMNGEEKGGGSGRRRIEGEGEEGGSTGS